MKRKIIILTILATSIPVLIMFTLTVDYQGITANQADVNFDVLAKMNIDQIAKDVYGLCDTTNDLIQSKVNNDLNVARRILIQQGYVNLGREMVTWQAENQYTGQDYTIQLPKMLVGNNWLGNSRNFLTSVSVVDDVKELVGGTCTIFQRMNEKGDMLRVATNVESLDNTRAIGTYIPAINPDGAQNPVINSVLHGNTFRGLAYVVNNWYITAYEPIKDNNGMVMGMLYVGEKLESVETLRETIMKTKVGKTGYVYVIGALGESKGTYIISKDGIRDGENIWDAKDDNGNFFIQSIVNKALNLKDGNLAYEEYPWKNIGEPAARNKIAAITYFEPWDWVICASMYEDDYHFIKNQFGELTDNLIKKLILVGICVLTLATLSAIAVSNRITRPLGLIINLANKIATGDLQNAKNDLAAFSKRYQSNKKSKLLISDADETFQLLDTFRTMTGSLDSLIGQVQQSGIQVTTSATEISASVQQLQAAVVEQAASAKQVSVTSKQISATSEPLVRTMDEVSETISETETMAESGRNDLNNMETVIQQLIKATNSISSKLSVINEKTNKISSVGITINKISDQTHLLALNAAIEAEKAGEYGRGFAVVAREINRLADQTAIATQEIEYMVKEMQSSVSSGVMEMDKFSEEVRIGVEAVATIGEQLGKIIDQVRALGPQFDTVKEGMHVQDQGAQEINDAINQLSDTAEQIKMSLNEFKMTTEQLNTAVQGLQSEVSRFKISS
ncbi:MAG: methyl-accepting chemotaxis protein [Candidatus Latescibacteria bacterium]|nr:methyl-accepting chemotaxis protein [Candidatus Latescibacterota bacterium]